MKVNSKAPSSAATLVAALLPPSCRALVLHQSATLLCVPHVAALATFGGLAPRYSVRAASVLNAVWALVLLFAGMGAATGMGGAAGALLFVIPLLALCSFNAIALWRRLRARQSAGT